MSRPVTAPMSLSCASGPFLSFSEMLNNVHGLTFSLETNRLFAADGQSCPAKTVGLPYDSWNNLLQPRNDGKT